MRSNFFSFLEDVLLATIFLGLLSLAYFTSGCAPRLTMEQLHAKIHAQHMQPTESQNPYTEPEGYAQPGPNPLGGDNYGDTREDPKDQTWKGPYPLNTDDPILRCSRNIEIEVATVNAEKVLPNGTLGKFIMAKTKDGRTIAILAMYPIMGMVYDRNAGTLKVETAHFATVYAVDLNNDGKADQVFTDKGGTGKCEDIVPYSNNQRDSKPEGQA